MATVDTHFPDGSSTFDESSTCGQAFTIGFEGATSILGSGNSLVGPKSCPFESLTSCNTGQQRSFSTRIKNPCKTGLLPTCVYFFSSILVPPTRNYWRCRRGHWLLRGGKLLTLARK